MPYPFFALLALNAAAPAAHDRQPLRFSLASTTGPRLVTVSIPLAPGEARSDAHWEVTPVSREEAVPAQSRSLGQYADGSPRALLVRFPWRRPITAPESFTLRPARGPAG